MARHSWNRLLAALVVAAALLGAGAAQADEPVASLTALPTSLSAGQGWVVWSVPAAGGGWSLVGAHDGLTARLPVDDGGWPLDVDIGTDAHGAAVATYSRCTGWYGYRQDFRDTSQASGCEARVLDLQSGRERAIGIRRSAFQSDTTPSMWRGNVAFARRDTRRNPSIAEVLVWTAKTGRVRTLQHGPVSVCHRGHTGCRPRGSVAALDLSARFAAFTWRGSRVGVQVDRLADGRHIGPVGPGPAATVSDVCMGGLDGWALHGPTITGSTLTYGEVTTSCYVSSSRVIAVDLGALRTRTAPVAGILHEYGVSGPDRYALLGASPDPVSSVAPSCSQPGPPCVLQKLTPLQFGPWTRARSARWR